MRTLFSIYFSFLSRLKPFMRQSVSTQPKHNTIRSYYLFSFNQAKRETRNEPAERLASATKNKNKTEKKRYEREKKILNAENVEGRTSESHKRSETSVHTQPTHTHAHSRSTYSLSEQITKAHIIKQMFLFSVVSLPVASCILLIHARATTHSLLLRPYTQSIYPTHH